MADQHRIYLDQMIGTQVGRALRNEGYDVIRASEVGQSRADDSQILQKAVAEKRTLVTLDDDFGGIRWLQLTMT